MAWCWGGLGQGQPHTPLFLECNPCCLHSLTTHTTAQKAKAKQAACLGNHCQGDHIGWPCEREVDGQPDGMSTTPALPVANHVGGVENVI